jgi:hypothetical protein
MKGEKKMAYSKTNSKGDTYYLHVNMRKLKSGKEIPLYYFSRELKPEKALDAVPEGKVVIEMKTGLPALKNKE